MTEDERLYLQFLQNNIARMNTNSAQTKGWCIAIVAALSALFAETKNELFMWICFIPVILFCILDALYLQQEHKFAKMYNAYIKGNENRPTVYEMPMKNYENGLKEFFKALRSWSVGFIYSTLLVILICIGSFTHFINTISKPLYNAEKRNLTDSPIFHLFHEGIDMTSLIIVLSIVFIVAIILSLVCMKKFGSQKHENSEIDLKCTIFTTIISPVIALLSAILVAGTLHVQNKDYKQNNYNTEFSILFDEMKDFINNLSIEIQYNSYSEEPVLLTKMEVVDELAYYLKRGKKVRQIYNGDITKIDLLKQDDNAWFYTNFDDFYLEGSKWYQIRKRPENECRYFESIDKRFRNIATPIFELLTNKDNEHREVQKHLFASYMNKNFFEAYLTTREKPQDIPDISVLNELIELSY